MGAMRSKIGLSLAWALVTLTAVIVTSAAVGSVRSNVTESAAPAFLLEDQPNSAQREAASLSAQSGPVTEDPSSDAPVPGAEPTIVNPDVAAPSSPTTTQATAITTTSIANPTTTMTSSTSTTTTPKPTSTIRSYTVVGGSVTVEADTAANGAAEIGLVGAVPNPGFTANEEERDDSTKVVVVFRSDDHESKILITFDNNELVTQVEETEEEEQD